METLFSRYRHTVVLIAALFCQLMVLAWQVKRPNSDVPLIREWFQALLLPTEKAAVVGFRGVAGIWDDYIALRGARQETLELEEQLKQQKLLNHQLREQVQELRRLQALVGFQRQSPLKTVAARVIGFSFSGTSRVLFINKGREDGLKINLPVLTPAGIVGKIQRVFRSSAQVLMITDTESGAGCLLETSRIHGLLKGQNGDFCQLRYVLNDEKVEAGERVFTSGEDGVYPKGLPVGVVAEVRPSAVFKEIKVRPAAQLDRLEEVLVVVKGEDQEIPERPVESAESQAGAVEGEIGPYPNPIGPPPPPSAVPKPREAAPSQSYRPGVPRGARPETDADRIRETYRQQMMDRVPKVPPPLKPATPPARPNTGTPPPQPQP